MIHEDWAGWLMQLRLPFILRCLPSSLQCDKMLISYGSAVDAELTKHFYTQRHEDDVGHVEAVVVTLSREAEGGKQ